MTANGAEIQQKNPNSKYKDKNYIRVTTAIRQLSKDDRLARWMINSFKTYDEYIESMRQSAERGSRVDEALKKILMGTKRSNLPQDEVLGIETYLDAFESFLRSWTIVARSTDEEVVDEELKLVGTLDIFGDIKNGETYPDAVIDIKTGHPTRDKDGSKKYEIYEEMHWQTAAYRKMKGAHSNWILRLFDDGEWRLEQDKNYQKSIEIITLAAKIAHARKK